ncbi:MAG: topoisomerase [Campylobacterota bacterium]|nr:topoisomerase [Campylobacterota bacterium]
MKSLIIVESPAKAKTIKNFLDNSFEVIASKGHIRDLPKKKMGVKVEDKRFIPEYVIDKEHEAIVKTLKTQAKKSDKIYIATDEDREGEAIGYHIAMALEKNPTELPRIVFHEITKKAILHSLENPRKLDMSKVNAQQARRVLDRLVGYNLSPLLASKIQKGLSAGRVQSSALKIVVDKEREIRAFVPQEFWTIDALFENELEAKIYEFEGKKLDKFDVADEKTANNIVNRVSKEKFKIAELDKKERKTASPAPFMTSTLQQSASSLLGYSPKKTMMIAQKLYEGVPTNNGVSGVITYMRTDSLYIAKEANDAARDYIKDTFGEKYLPEKAKIYKTNSKQAQEAHEAIRPVNVAFTPLIAHKYLKPDELKLYTLIYNRFIASQMKDAILEIQNLFLKSDSSVFKANGKRVVFDGFYKILGDKDKDSLLPELKIDSSIELKKIDANQHFTEPPSRYSEAGLIKALESMGIGRPSTYAPTITTLQNRLYLDIEKKQLIPTEIAFTVTELLEKNFDQIVNPNFTANMENELDKIAENEKDWEEVLNLFYGPFIESIKNGKKDIQSLKKVEPTGEKCPECGAELVKRSGRFGEFISCSNFPKCRYTQNLQNKNEPKQEAEQTDEKCEKCGSPMVIKMGRNGKFMACSNYPKCKNTKSLAPETTIDVKCPKCGGDIVEKKSKRGVFYGCKNYPKCDYISAHKPTDKKCPECSMPMARRTVRKKEIYECTNSKCKHKEDVI